MLHIALSATIVYNGIVGYNHQQWDLRESTMRPGNPVFCNMNKWARSHEQKEWNNWILVGGFNPSEKYESQYWWFQPY